MIGARTMNRAERALTLILRGSAVLLLIALIPAVMPFAWMEEIHRHLGMGELPRGPIVGYLTRSLSALYAMHGALIWYVSLDVRRFLPLIKCLAALAIAFGIGMLVLDPLVGMPLFWTLGEGPFIVLLGVVMLWLCRRSTGSHAEPPAKERSQRGIAFGEGEPGT